MEQPFLPEIRPYVNRNLFSLHFLDQVLPQDASWQVHEDKLRLSMLAIKNLLSTHKDVLPQLNEAQLERRFARPMLEALGHCFEVQPKLPTPEGPRWPDYALFATREDQTDALREHEGELEYFTKAIAITDAKRWGRPLDKSQRRGTDKFDMLNPSWQIDYYLRISEVPWGVLTDGRFWRLYNRETSFRLDVYYEVDLPQLMAERDIEAFKYLYLFFRPEAFIRDAEGLCFLDRVYQGSLEYARAVGDDLKENVYRALRLLAEGLLDTRGNNLDAERDLEAIHEYSLIYLYRLLFINYAEDRLLLPKTNPIYRHSYGLVSIETEVAAKLDRREHLSPVHTHYWDHVMDLFRLINQGSETLGIGTETMYVPPYNGGLFDPERHDFLEQNKVADRWLGQVIDLLARSKGEGLGRALVDYTSLDVRHLGSIYEGLLEYKLRVAAEERVAVKRRGREEWVPAKEAEGKKVIETVERGGLYLATDRGERKATGSYYTPDYIVKYIVEHTVGPLIEEKMTEDDPIEGILSLKVLDPAMGSGHFLVEVIDRLAHALVEALVGTEEEHEEEDVRWARREVVERCIYGVDLNPLAVELAKLSLWLHTVAEGKPLNFLNHHLKVGNSLVGAWVDDLGSLPARRKRGKAEGEVAGVRQMNLFETRLDERLPTMLNRVLEIMRRGSETLEDIKAKVAADEAVEELKAPFKAVANLWVSTYFGNEVTEGDYQEALEHIGEPEQLLALPAVERGGEIGEDKRFFHWELEFPEAFHEDTRRRPNPGFDAVIGNPPYVKIQAIEATEKTYLTMAFRSATGKFDMYMPFFEQAVKLTRGEGCAAFIMPSKFTQVAAGAGLREHMLSEARMSKFVDLQDFQVFEDATTYTSIVLCTPETPRPSDEVAIVLPRDIADLERVEPVMISYGELTEEPWSLRALAEPSLQLVVDCLPLGQLCSDICKGIDPGGATNIFVLPASTAEKNRIEAEISPGIICGDDIDRWGFELTRRIVFPYRESGGAYVPIADLSDFPHASAYLLPFREKLASRAYVARAGKEWYELWNPRQPSTQAVPKLVICNMSRANRFAFDEVGLLTLHTTYSIILRDAAVKNYHFAMSLLNTRVLTYLFQQLSTAVRGGYYRYNKMYLERVPMRRIWFTTTEEERAQSVEVGLREVESEVGRSGGVGAKKAYAAFLDSGLGGLVNAWLEAEPERADVIHDLLAHLAQRMIETNEERLAEARGFLDWLAAHTGLPIEEWRLKTVVKAYWKHGWDELQRALGQNRKPIEKASGRNVEGREAVEAIETEFEKSVACLAPLMERIASTDRLIDLIVYRLYGLTDQEVAIVEESATR